jgi:hypothetical protein
MTIPLLYDDAFAPVTSQIGFLAADIARVVETYLAWQADLAAGRIRGPEGVPRPSRLAFLPRRFLRRKSIVGPLSQALSEVLPLTVPFILRRLFVPTAGPWTAYFDSFVLGTDAFPPISYLAQRIGCRGLRVTAISEEREARRTRGRRDAASILELYEPHQTDWLNIGRSIAMMKDGRWRFELGGTEQPFEEPENYAKARIKDRFTVAMLERYLRALGIRAFDESFYMPQGTEAVLIEEPAWWRRVKTFSLEAALTRHDDDPAKKPTPGLATRRGRFRDG